MGNAMKVPASRGTAEGSRLTHVVERLAEESAALARTRRARASDGESLLVMLLREIDETVLPRRIVLASDTGEVARMAVSNRRLTALWIEGEANPAGSEPTDPASAARHYAHRLQTLLDRRKQLVLRVDRGTPPENPDGLSCSARSLAACIGLSLVPATGGSGEMRDFLRAAEGFTLAWLYVGGKSGEDRHRGPETLVAGLRAFRVLDQKAAMASIRATRPRCLILPLPDGRALLRATAGTEQVLSLLPGDATPAAMVAWKKVFGTAAG